jgi:hypothetical protein
MLGQINEILSWVVPVLVGIASVAVAIWAWVLSKEKILVIGTHTTDGHTKVLTDHEIRIRNLETACADQRAKMASIETNVLWIKHYLEQERGGK